MSAPIRVQVTRWRCPHCKRTHAKQAATRTHMARCWGNPDNRACKTCRHLGSDVASVPICHRRDGVDLVAHVETGCPDWQPA